MLGISSPWIAWQVPFRVYAWCEFADTKEQPPILSRRIGRPLLLSRSILQKK
jgi:hypothetical protein